MRPIARYRLQQPLGLLAALLLFQSTATADVIDDYVNRVLDEERIPGVAVLVMHNGRIEKLQGYGFANLEHRVPVSADTIFQSGSVGKLFTAAAVLRLAEQDKLDLDDPLSRHFNDAPSDWHGITIRHLLTHTSGIKDYGDEFDYRRDYTDAEQLEVATALPLEFEPGTQWSYSNSGYMVLGLLVTQLAGEHWSDYLDSEIFSPAGMDTARVISESDIIAHRAAGYERAEDGSIRNQAWVAPPFNRQGDGALYFSVRDLAAFGKALRSRSLLGEHAYAAWWSATDLGNGITYPYGFGWDVTDRRGRRVVEHGGAWQGFRAFLSYHLDDDLVIAVLANIDDAEPGTIAHTIAGLVVPALALPATDTEARDPDPALTAKLSTVLEAWADREVVAAMAPGLAQTRTGSERETYGREYVAELLDAQTGFRWLGEDDVSELELFRRGGRVARIVYYALDNDDVSVRYRFYLTADDRVLDFGET